MGNLEPINIKKELKNFLTYMKFELKRKYSIFFPDTKALLYYLNDSEKFRTDYEKYLKMVELS